MYKVITFLFLFTAFSSAYAQNTDRQFFDAPAQKRSMNERSVNKVFDAKKGELVTLVMADGSQVDFVVNMNEWNQESVRSIGGKLAGNMNTYITITQLDDAKGILYEGSIVSKKSDTAFKIYGGSESVYFEKTSKDKIIVTD